MQCNAESTRGFEAQSFDHRLLEYGLRIQPVSAGRKHGRQFGGCEGTLVTRLHATLRGFKHFL